MLRDLCQNGASHRTRKGSPLAGCSNSSPAACRHRREYCARAPPCNSSPRMGKPSISMWSRLRHRSRASVSEGGGTAHMMTVGMASWRELRAQLMRPPRDGQELDARPFIVAALMPLEDAPPRQATPSTIGTIRHNAHASVRLASTTHLANAGVDLSKVINWPATNKRDIALGDAPLPWSGAALRPHTESAHSQSHARLPAHVCPTCRVHIRCPP